MTTPADWLTTEQAADLLCVVPKVLSQIPKDSITRRRQVKAGDCPGRRGYVWLRREVEYVAEIRKVAHVSMNAALRVFMAIRNDALKLSAGDRLD